MIANLLVQWATAVKLIGGNLALEIPHEGNTHYTGSLASHLTHSGSRAQT
jgi:hypothetical protein